MELPPFFVESDFSPGGPGMPIVRLGGSECRTGWIWVEPGTEQTRDATGYIQIEESGTRMAIYHLWGEI